MIYKELVSELKRIKKSKDIDEEILEMLTQVTIDAHMRIFMLDDDEVSPIEALKIARETILEEFDFMLVSLISGISDQAPDLDNLPMGDEILKEQLDKVFTEYNNRIEDNSQPKSDSKIRRIK